MHAVGVLNPSDAQTAGVIAEIGKQIKAVPPHRIFVPGIEVLGRAALLSGILCRLQGYEKDGKLRALQDCVLFLQAQKLGLVVLITAPPARRPHFPAGSSISSLFWNFSSAGLRPRSTVCARIESECFHTRRASRSNSSES